MVTMLAQIVLFYYLAFCLVCLSMIDYRKRRGWWLAGLLTIVGLVVVAVVARQTRGESLLQSLLFGWYAEGRGGFFTRISALAMGVFSAVSLFGSVSQRWLRLFQVAALAVGVGAITLLLFRDTLTNLVSDPKASVSSGFISVSSAKGVKVRRIDLPFYPTAVTTGKNVDEVFVTGYIGAYLQGGAVYRYDVAGEEIKSKQVANGFTRPHGLAYDGGDLFVSRAGQFNRAIKGRMEQEKTGAVTRMKDLDSDGVFDYYEDIVSGLPGAQMPDGLHQNNGIEIFDGKLYVTVGVSTDHTPAVLDLEGTIMRCNLDGSELTPYAKGLRNPYGISIGPHGKIYVTDNDPNFAELGDKFCLVEEGTTFQFPYDTVEGVKVDGGVPPLKRFSSAQGISYVPAGEKNAFEDRILMASYGDNALSAVRVNRNAQGEYQVDSEFVAKISQVVDTHYAGSNVAYACSYAEKALYRIEFDNKP